MNRTEIRIMTSGAFTAAYLALIPRLEQLTGKKLVTAATSIGSGENSIPNRLRRRESVDVVIVADTVLRGFIKEGLIVADSYTPLARSAIGMAMRKGAPKPDIGTVDALTSTLLQAQSIAYSASVSGEYLTNELLQRLGIADRVLPKCRRVEGGERVGAVIARGEAEIGFQQISELLPVPGIDHITPLPPEVQKLSIFSAGVPRRPVIQTQHARSSHFCHRSMRQSRSKIAVWSRSKTIRRFCPTSVHCDPCVAPRIYCAIDRIRTHFSSSIPHCVGNL